MEERFGNIAERYELPHLLSIVPTSRLKKRAVFSEYFIRNIFR